MRFVAALVVALTVTLWPANVPSGLAQCSMCRTTLTQSEQGRELASGLNRGILFLLAIPLLVVGSGVVALRMHERRLNALRSGEAAKES